MLDCSTLFPAQLGLVWEYASIFLFAVNTFSIVHCSSALSRPSIVSHHHCSHNLKFSISSFARSATSTLLALRASSSKLDEGTNRSSGHSSASIGIIRRRVHHTCDIDVGIADEVLLLRIVGAVDDQSVDESLEEDGSRASSCSSSTGV